MWQRYFSPTTVSEVLDLLANNQNRARIIAGGTDILLELERGARPTVDTLIDITRIPGLSEIAIEDGVIRVGPLATHNHVVGSEITRQYALPLVQACWEVGAPQIRNRATIAGNLITASPANDTITPLMALGASVVLQSQTGERIIDLADFYRGYRQTVMKPDEFLREIRIPTIEENQAGMFMKLSLRRAQAISVIDIATVLTFEDGRDSPVADARVTIGCVAPTIIRLSDAENALIGNTLTDAIIKTAAEQAAAMPTPIDDVRGTAEYRVEMITVYLRRMLRHLRDATEEAGLVTNPAMLWGHNQGHIHQSLSQQVTHERDSADTIVTTVNGKQYTTTGGSHKTLLRYLRDEIGLTGTKEGCAEGECGACTVFLDDMAVMSCMVAAPRAHGADIVTIEGLQAPDGALHPLQQGFIDTGAVQCGFCTPGFLMAGAKLLDEIPDANRQQIAQSISGNLCRCTGYYKILEAFDHAKKAGERENG